MIIGFLLTIIVDLSTQPESVRSSQESYKNIFFLET